MGKSSSCCFQTYCFPCMHTIIMVATITAMVTISIIIGMVNTTITGTTITTITTMVTIATTSLPVCASWDFPELPPSSLTKSSPPLYISKTPAPWGIYHKIHWTFSMNIVWQFVLSPSACLANTCFVTMNIGILWQRWKHVFWTAGAAHKFWIEGIQISLEPPLVPLWSPENL